MVGQGYDGTVPLEKHLKRCQNNYMGNTFRNTFCTFYGKFNKFSTLFFD